MTDDKENKKPETPPADTDDKPEKPPLRKISDDELQTILGEHKKWLETERSLGKRADFSEANLKQAGFFGETSLDEVDLSEAFFINTDLRGAWIRGTNLHGARLIDSDCRDAELLQSDLQGARILRVDLRKARLRETNLSNARLSDCKFDCADLSRCNLSGADIRDATGLAEAILNDCNFEGATGLKGTEFARADITGARLPADIREFKSLKVVEEISKNARKIFLAMLLGCAYALLTIATTTDARLLTNSASSPLPIIRTEIPIAYFYLAAPFILIGLFVYLHLYLQRLWEGLSKLPAIFEDGKRLDERAYPWLLNGLVRRHFEKLKKGRSLMAHLEEYASIFLAWWVLPLTLGAFWYRYLWKHDWTGTFLHVGLIVLSVTGAILFYRSHARTLRGSERITFPWLRFYRDRRTYQTLAVAVVGIALVFGSFGAIEGLVFTDNDGNAPCWARADLREAQLSIKPANYWSLDPAVRDSAVMGANLKDADLRYARLGSAFLVNADLRYTDLRQSWLLSANLTGADLLRANLTETVLADADLTGANLEQADLAGAFIGAANLTTANLEATNLTGAILTDANLSDASLKSANLTNASLSGTVLWGANLESASLIGADLRSAEGLSQNSLDRACGDTLTTKLPPGLTIKQCP